MITPDEIKAVRGFLTHCTLNDTPKVLGLCQQLLSEIELQQQIIEQHTNQFFNGELHASNETSHQSNGVRSYSTTKDTAQPEPVRTVSEVQPPQEARHQGSGGGDQSEAEDDLPEYRDYRAKERRDQERLDDSRLRAEVDGTVRTQEGDVTPSGKQIDRAMTRNQRRRNKRKQKRGNK